MIFSKMCCRLYRYFIIDNFFFHYTNYNEIFPLFTMFKNKTNKIYLGIQNIFLYIFVSFFCIFSSLPITFFSGFSIFPNISQILIFYFFVIKNTSYFAIFVFGLMFDIFNNLILGTTSLIWLISAKLILFLRQNLYTPDKILFLFRDFIIFAFTNFILQWFIYSILNRISYPLSRMLYQLIIDIIFFIIIFIILIKTKKYNY